MKVYPWSAKVTSFANDLVLGRFIGYELDKLQDAAASQFAEPFVLVLCGARRVLRFSWVWRCGVWSPLPCSSACAGEHARSAGREVPARATRGLVGSIEHAFCCLKRNFILLYYL